MPIFRYKGYSSDGSETAGIIEADGQRDAALRIRSKGIFPKEIHESSSRKNKYVIRRPSRFALSIITRRLSLLLSSGVQLIEAIGSISIEQKGIWKDILQDIKERVAGGATLARAMQEHSIFPTFFTAMIAAGESSGELTGVLLKLADYIEAEESTKSKVQTALIYPLFMASASVLIVFFLFTFVIPKITGIFEGTSAPLPFITVLLITISASFQKYWWIILALGIATIFIVKNISARNRELIDALFLKEPTGILMSLYMLRFSTAMSFLLSGGLPILPSLQLTSKTTGNRRLEHMILSAKDHVSHGAKLSASLEGFPLTVLQIIATGEQTGQLANVLKKTAETYEEEFNRKLQRAIGLLEPLLILFMGGIVGFIVLAILLPIFEINQLIR